MLHQNRVYTVCDTFCVFFSQFKSICTVVKVPCVHCKMSLHTSPWWRLYYFLRDHWIKHQASARGAYAASQITFIRKTRLYNFDPLKPHFYIVKLGFTGGIHYFSYFCSKHILWVLVRTASARQLKRVPTIYVLSRNMKSIRVFIWKLSVFGGEIFNISEKTCFRNGYIWRLWVKFSTYNIVKYFSFIFPGNRIWQFMQIVSNLHEIVICQSYYLGKIRKTSSI